MSINGAKPDDIFIDGNGKTWRVLKVEHSPRITVEAANGSDFLCELASSSVWSDWQRVTKSPGSW